jgi:hypothetical protein
VHPPTEAEVTTALQVVSRRQRRKLCRLTGGAVASMLGRWDNPWRAGTVASMRAGRTSCPATTCVTREGCFARSEEAAMHAQPGDWLVVEGRDIAHHARRAEILSVHSPDGGPPYRVRWTDDGHEALVVPGPDAHVVTAAEQAGIDAEAAEHVPAPWSEPGDRGSAES